jgi:hypothetical protein
MSISSVKTGAIGDSLLAGNAAYDPGDFQSIATAVGTGSSGTITFSSIPSTYTHLQLRIIGRSTSTSTTVNVTANSDTGSNYARHYLYGDGSTAGAGANTSQTSMAVVFVAQSIDLANSYGVNVLDILDYSNTNKYKTTRVLTGLDVNGSGGYIQLTSGLWQSTAAISTLTLTLSSANFTTASQFALYGIKG